MTAVDIFRDVVVVVGIVVFVDVILDGVVVLVVIAVGVWVVLVVVDVVAAADDNDPWAVVVVVDVVVNTLPITAKLSKSDYFRK